MKILLKSILFTILLFTSVSAENKEFIKEYTYNASDDDSKNSSRKKAIAQIKVLVSEEVGTMIKSRLTIQTKQDNEKLDQFVNSKIDSMSQSFMKLSILKENWNGSEYYIKAKVMIDKSETKNIIDEFKKSEKTYDTSKKTYVEMRREQPIFINGEMAYTANEGDVFVVVAEIDCMRGGGRCWVMKNTKTGDKGVARVSILKSFNKVYKK